MNYKKHYDLLIKKARNRCILKSTYSEIHHIIPISIGGTNDDDNLVALLPEEHLIAHLLLVKINPNEPKLWYAAKMMTNMRRVNNKKYRWIKEGHALMLTSQPPKPRIDIDIGWLQNELKTKTIKKISDDLNVDFSTILNRVNNHKLVVHTKNVSGYQLEKMDINKIKELLEIMTIADVAKELNVSKHIIITRIKKYNLEANFKGCHTTTTDDIENIQQTLMSSPNKIVAAEKLGISIDKLNSRIKKYKLVNPHAQSIEKLNISEMQTLLLYNTTKETANKMGITLNQLQSKVRKYKLKTPFAKKRIKK